MGEPQGGQGGSSEWEWGGGGRNSYLSVLQAPADLKCDFSTLQRALTPINNLCSLQRKVQQGPKNGLQTVKTSSLLFSHKHKVQQEVLGLLNFWESVI